MPQQAARSHSHLAGTPRAEIRVQPFMPGFSTTTPSLLSCVVTVSRADAILALVPAEDARLIRHIRKQKQRMDKKKHAPVKKTHEGFDLLFGTDDKTVSQDHSCVLPFKLVLR